MRPNQVKGKSGGTRTANVLYIDGHVENKGSCDLPSKSNMYAAFTSSAVTDCGFDRSNCVILKP